MESYIGDAVDYVIEDDDVIMKILLGIGMLLLSFLIIPSFLFQGYLMRVLKQTEGESPTSMPSWDNWKLMAIEGIQGFAISVIVNLPALILFIAGIVVENTILIVVGFIIMLVTSFATPVFLTLGMRDGFSGLLDVPRVLDVTFSTEYFLAWVLLFVAGLIMGIGSLIINILTFGLGSIVFLLIGPAINYGTMHIIGRSVTNAESSQ